VIKTNSILPLKEAFSLIKTEISIKDIRFNINKSNEILIVRHSKLYSLKINKTKKGKITKKEIRRYALKRLSQHTGKLPRAPKVHLAPKSSHKNLYYGYLNSKEWKAIVNFIKKDRGGQCERCNNKRSLQVHHKTYDNIFQENMEDLELLCGKCHKKEHNISN